MHTGLLTLQIETSLYDASIALTPYALLCNTPCYDPRFVQPELNDSLLKQRGSALRCTMPPQTKKQCATLIQAYSHSSTAHSSSTSAQVFFPSRLSSMRLARTTASPRPPKLQTNTCVHVMHVSLLSFMLF